MDLHILIFCCSLLNPLREKTRNASRRNGPQLIKNLNRNTKFQILTTNLPSFFSFQADFCVSTTGTERIGHCGER